jgi:hypothetical protein
MNPSCESWNARNIDRAAKVLGIQRITHHDLRHLFATRSIESGVDIPTGKSLIGSQRWRGFDSLPFFVTLSCYENYCHGKSSDKPD